MEAVLASLNPGKLNEMQQLLQKWDWNIRSQAEFITDAVEETGLSFVENAILKARYACEHSGLAAIADDSGVVVPALQGAPGIFSARYAGENATDADNNAKLIAATAHLKQPVSAYYVCVVVFMQHAQDPTPLIAEGRWHGEVLQEARGNNGFGYDPHIYFAE